MPIQPKAESQNRLGVNFFNLLSPLAVNKMAPTSEVESI
jgi:hypothetical protein